MSFRTLRVLLTAMVSIAMLVTAGKGNAAWAGSLRVDRSEGRTRLRADACEALASEIEALSRWEAKRVGRARDRIAPRRERGSCEARIDSFLPEAFRTGRDDRARYDGPNCWNAALVSTGVLSHKRYASDRELRFWLRSPLCRELAPEEETSPGDLIAIRQQPTRDRTTGDIHAFVWLTPSLAFSKDGYTRQQPYQFTTPSELYRIYGPTGTEPARCRSATGVPTGCGRWANRYRCSPMREFLRIHERALNPRLREGLARVDALEQRPGALEKNELESLRAEGLSAVRSLAGAGSDPTRGAQLFLWRSILAKVSSLRQQQWIYDISRHDSGAAQSKKTSAEKPLD